MLSHCGKIVLSLLLSCCEHQWCSPFQSNKTWSNAFKRSWLHQLHVICLQSEGDVIAMWEIYQTISFQMLKDNSEANFIFMPKWWQSSMIVVWYIRQCEYLCDTNQIKTNFLSHHAFTGLEAGLSCLWIYLQITSTTPPPCMAVTQIGLTGCKYVTPVLVRTKDENTDDIPNKTGKSDNIPELPFT